MKIDITNKLMLAPLAGYTDQAMRRIALKWGADILYSEMVSARAIRYKDKKTTQMLTISPEEIKKGTVAIQLFGSDKEDLAYSVDYLNTNPGTSIVDLNLGCPAPKIVKNGDGSALLKDPDKIYTLLKAMREATDMTLSAKIRTGIEGMDNYLEVAQAVEESGVDYIIVHGRTREQQYAGVADWEKIIEIKENISIPVVGNGDITDPHIAKERLNRGVDALMIGRGAVGAPWIFKQIKEYISTGDYTQITVDQRFDTMIEHLVLSVDLKGQPVGVLEMRKQIHKYLAGLEGSAAIRNSINQVVKLQDVVDILNQYRTSIIDKE